MENQELRGAILSDCRPEQPMDRCENGAATPTPDRGGNKIRQINIEEVNRGFIVRVGCHTFAISTKAELTTKLTEYINEPDKTEKKWYNGDLF
jgi:hypothetical protein